MKILIAEDDKDTALLYKEALEKRGQQVIISNTGQQCLEIYHNCGALHTIRDRQGQNSHHHLNENTTSNTYER